MYRHTVKAYRKFTGVRAVLAGSEGATIRECTLFTDDPRDTTWATVLASWVIYEFEEFATAFGPLVQQFLDKGCMTFKDVEFTHMMDEVHENKIEKL